MLKIIFKIEDRIIYTSLEKSNGSYLFRKEDF